MRLMTFNIHGWRTKEGAANHHLVVDAVRESQADIVGLNEVFHPYREGEGENSHSNGSVLAQVADELGMQWVFGPCLRWPATTDLPEKSYGNGLLSRWPIIASAAHHLTPVPEKEQRGLLEGRVLLPGGDTFTVYVTHLDHTDEDARLVQLRALRSWTVRDRNRPHVVMGDFNAVSPPDFAGRRAELEELVANHPPSGPLLTDEGMRVIPQMEKAGYVDAMRALDANAPGTFIPAAVPLRIDYIFLSQPLAPALVAGQVWQEEPGEEASDHRPVVVDIGE